MIHNIYSSSQQLIEEYVTSSLDYFHLDYFFRNATTEEINLQLDLNLTKSKPKDILMTYSSVLTSLESGAVIYAKFSPGRACSYFQDGQTVGGEITGWRVHDFVMQNTRLQFALYTGTAGTCCKTQPNMLFSLGKIVHFKESRMFAQHRVVLVHL